MGKILLGVVDYQPTVIYAEIKDGLIRGFDGYDYISSEMAADDYNYLSNCMWVHEVTIGGKTYKSGEKLPSDIKFHSEYNITEEMVEDAIETNGCYCSTCGTFHDTEATDLQPEYVFTECELHCKSCLGPEDLVTEVNEPDDLFKAADITGMKRIKGYHKVTELFCDSSGVGSEHEPALTKASAEKEVEKLLEKHGTLYAGLTGIGQFQVYVTLYKKV